MTSGIEQDNFSEKPALTRASLVALVLSYAIALPWLIWGEAANLVPLLGALVFGYCLIRPCALAFQRAPRPVKGLVVTIIAVLITAIVVTLTGGHEKALLLPLRSMPKWLANHFFFVFFACLPLTKGIAVGGIQLITRMVNSKSRPS